MPWTRHNAHGHACVCGCECVDLVTVFWLLEEFHALEIYRRERVEYLARVHLCGASGACVVVSGR